MLENINLVMKILLMSLSPIICINKQKNGKFGPIQDSDSCRNMLCDVR